MDRANKSSRLRQFIEAESGGMLGTLRFYLYRAGLGGRGQPLDAAANELLSEVVAEALAHEDRFIPTGQPRAWLLGIAANLVRRRQVEFARRDQREPLVRDLYPGLEEAMSDDELFDWMIQRADVDTVEELERDQSAAALLNAVSPDDARVLRLAILNGLDGDSLARMLGISPGAARVRLHRALNRLRAAHQEVYHDEA
ncbi:MAG: sigma-70 family RNA polymerase sigma factor [Anaerolineae bacterium]|nr:sigma-70 family RNA polymerase sigma factor [Anaerolineae bacterium]